MLSENALLGTYETSFAMEVPGVVGLGTTFRRLEFSSRFQTLFIGNLNTLTRCYAAMSPRASCFIRFTLVADPTPPVVQPHQNGNYRFPVLQSDGLHSSPLRDAR